MTIDQNQIVPEDCPEPWWHQTHRYCPACSWVEPVDHCHQTRTPCYDENCTKDNRVAAQPERELEWREPGPRHNENARWTCGALIIVMRWGDTSNRWLYDLVLNFNGHENVMGSENSLPAAKSLAAKLAAVLHGGDE